MSQKIRVAVLFGGKSVEHKVSLRSAKNIIDHIDRQKFDVVLIGIDQQGSWYFLENYSKIITEGESLGLSLSQKTDPFYVMADNRSLGEVDVVFPVLHGNDGEDGSIQGLLRTINIPFVGSGVLGSSIAFDKLCTKKLLQQADIPSAKYTTIKLEDKDKINVEHIKKLLGLPFFIKPVASGSSVGVFKVKDKQSFEFGINDAFQYDNILLIEEFIEGREIEVAVKGNNQIEASLPGEIRIVGNHDFYSFDAKYVDDTGAELDMPADLHEVVRKNVQKLAINAYKALYCEDYARVDMFLKQNGDIIINEVNTIPGFTHISMFPQLWTLSGVNYTQLISQLISFAIEKHEQAIRIKREFDSAL